MEEKKLTPKLFIILGAVLLFTIPLSYSLVKNLARTNSTINLATWNVSLNQSQENNYLSIVPNPNETTESYTVNITSQSEVDVIYSIIIENLPSGVSISLDGGTYVPASNNKVMFSDVGTIAYTDLTKTKSHTLTFKATSGASAVINQEVDVNVIVRQSI